MTRKLLGSNAFRWSVFALLFVHAALLVEPQSLAQEAARPLYEPTAIPRSGTETVTVRSDWKGSEGEAETQASNKLDAEVRATTAKLMIDGKKVIGGTTFATMIAERKVGDKIQFQATMRRQLNWVFPYKIENVSTENAGGGIANAAFVVRNLRGAIQGSSIPPDNAELVVYLEEELGKRVLATSLHKDYTKPVFSEMKIVKANVVLGESVVNLPATMVSDRVSIENWTDAEIVRSYSRTLRITESETYTFEKSLTTTDQLTATLSYTPINSVGFGGSIGGTTTRQLTIGKSNSHVKESTREETESFDLKVPPKTSLTNAIVREVLRQSISLKGPITFDGYVETEQSYKDVYACGAFGTDRCSRWKTRKLKSKLSDILSEADRTLTLDGNLTISSATSTKSKVVVTSNGLTGEPPLF